MKAVLEFNLPKDSEEYAMANNASKYHCILHEHLMVYLRNETKYGEDPCRVEIMMEVRQHLIELLGEYGVELD